MRSYEKKVLELSSQPEAKKCKVISQETGVKATECSFQLSSIPKYFDQQAIRRYLTQKGFHPVKISTPSHPEPSASRNSGKLVVKLKSGEEKTRLEKEFGQVGISASRTD